MMNQRTDLLAKLKRRMKYVVEFFFRNRYTTEGKKTKPKQVNLEWVSNHNLGDELAPVIYDWMLKQKGIERGVKINRTVHLMTVGSMIGSWKFDAVIWGSGIHLFSNYGRLYSLRWLQKFDIRAVRGPVTRSVLKSCGHECPEIYGDPAVLMPLIYSPKDIRKRYKISVVLHYHAANQWEVQLLEREDIHILDIHTDDYRQYIDEMVASERIISSSLHGIILAEAYGIPAVFLNTGGYVNEALLKYYDWYYSTERYNVKMAKSIDEAIRMTPMELPKLKSMQKSLIDAFPYDLWGV